MPIFKKKVLRVSPGCRQGVARVSPLGGCLECFGCHQGVSGCLRCLLLLRFQGVLRVSPGSLLLPRPRHAALEEHGAQQVKKTVKERGDSSFLALGEKGRLLLPRPRRETSLGEKVALEVPTARRRRRRRRRRREETPSSPQARREETPSSP
jgi:hypothetical protein